MHLTWGSEGLGFKPQTLNPKTCLNLDFPYTLLEMVNLQCALCAKGKEIKMMELFKYIVANQVLVCNKGLYGFVFLLWVDAKRRRGGRVWRSREILVIGSLLMLHWVEVLPLLLLL
jgi:hypothetical protein